MTVFTFIGGGYNPQRRHSALRNISPMQFEKRADESSFISSKKLSTETG